MMAVNLVLASGVVKSLALKYDHQSRPELRFTLEQRDGEFCLWLPCFTPGAAAERLAGDLEDGMHICITSGRLAYKKRPTKAGEQARLEILVWSIERLSESPQVERTDEGKAIPRLTNRQALLSQRGGRRDTKNGHLKPWRQIERTMA